MKAEPIRIVVADDELPIRQELVNFPWEKYGFCLSGAGRNGKDALEICRSEKPDVLLTDITMPVMDGLELIRTLKQEQPEIKCVILTCHQDFDYAKKAITYNALDYILKLDLSESILSETLKQIKEAVEQERKAKSKANIEHRAAFSRLISVQPVDREKLQNEMTRLRFGLNQDSSFCFLLVENYLDMRHRFETSADASYTMKQSDSHSSSASAALWNPIDYDIQCELCEVSEVSSWLYVGNGCYALETITNSAECFMSIINRLTEVLTNKYPYAVDQFKLRLIRIQNPMTADVLISKCKCVPLWRANAFYHPDKAILSEGSIVVCKEADKNDWTEFQSKMNEVLKSPNVMEQSLTEWCLDKHLRPDDLLSFFCDWLKNSHPDFADTSGTALWREFQNTTDISQAVFILKKYCGVLPTFSYRPEIRKAVQIIHEEYGSELTLNEVSQRVGLSAPYLSSLFREEVGENFNDYLTRLRIETAEALIKNGELKIYEIADKVGVPNYRYFSAIFKKWTGKSPKDLKSDAEKGL